MLIAIGADHAGFAYKEAIKENLLQKGFQVKDFGTHSTESVDYPDFAHPVALSVESGECKRGILICGSGNGVAMTANKHAQIRAALCWNEEIAQLARLHNDANVICLPARFVSIDEALKMVETFLKTDFEGGRHENRVKKICG
ncbi:ribose 5-phosphate isomerase B [Raineya orbicola]|jgi:ribose 5-phosphate isomerase B|uniref:Sugar-phosphate isomerase, RpiB/LacA/LacB family n=1 Tax=Raineya orbicola TaxID=2016530 RepID=A0A2N3I532_9BACT|nr:ribose 5-phosphate isomerase B [Raineya orbicola]PKQ65424.1 Sugar-phosphate isomerase, RpiB/LacA/LacB family [Raineya orbicola]